MLIYKCCYRDYILGLMCLDLEEEYVCIQSYIWIVSQYIIIYQKIIIVKNFVEREYF